MEYSVRVMKIAEAMAPGPINFYMSHWDELQYSPHFIWLVQGQDRTILINTGLPQDPEDLEILPDLPFEPRLIEMAGWHDGLYAQIKSRFPESLVCLRLDFDRHLQEKLLQSMRKGIHIFHLVANYHGCGIDGGFMLELVRQAHQTFVEAGCRDEVTLLGSGGIIAAEHVPKAILCGLDAVALDTAPVAALQARFIGECIDRETSHFRFNKKINAEWGVQRLKNLLASWRDQMLEVLGAMGLREVRRLRGEVGRAMFQEELEREAFGDIEGYGES